MTNRSPHADPIAIRLAAALVALSHKHPQAAQDIDDLLLYVPGLKGAVPAVRPLGQAPTDDPECAYLLFCPAQGGWQTGVFIEGQWRDYATRTKGLEPTHIADLPPPPETP